MGSRNATHGPASTCGDGEPQGTRAMIALMSTKKGGFTWHVREQYPSPRDVSFPGHRLGQRMKPMPRPLDVQPGGLHVEVARACLWRRGRNSRRVSRLMRDYHGFP